MPSLLMDIVWECWNEESSCKSCPCKDHCKDGRVFYEECDIEFYYEEENKGSWHEESHGSHVDISSVYYRGEDIFTTLPSSLLDDLTEEVLTAYENQCADNYMQERYEAYLERD